MKSVVRYGASRPTWDIWERLEPSFPDELRKRMERPTQFRIGRATEKISCPLGTHADSDPSCSVTRKVNSQGKVVWLYHCFSCGQQGDGIDLLAALDQRSVPDWMSEYRHDIDPTAPLPRVTPLPPPPPPWSQADYDQYVAECHLELLSGQRAGDARAYCRSRGLDGGDVRRYRLGFSVPTSLPKLKDMRGFWWRLVFPCAGGLNGRATDGRLPKYMSVNLTLGRQRPWLIDDLDPSKSDLVLVEGCFDALALRKCDELQAVALRGKNLSWQDASALRFAGFNRAYICLDPGTSDKEKQAIATQLRQAGMEAFIVHGLDEGDFGDLLPQGPEALINGLETAMQVVAE